MQTTYFPYYFFQPYLFICFSFIFKYFHHSRLWHFLSFPLVFCFFRNIHFYTFVVRPSPRNKIPYHFTYHLHLGLDLHNFHPLITHLHFEYFYRFNFFVLPSVLFCSFCNGKVAFDFFATFLLFSLERKKLFLQFPCLSMSIKVKKSARFFWVVVVFSIEFYQSFLISPLCQTLTNSLFFFPIKKISIFQWKLISFFFLNLTEVFMHDNVTWRWRR